MTSRTRPRRFHERGTAMVEAAFMMPMFVILYFASGYLYSLNYVQLNFNAATRVGAWSYAMSNCAIAYSDDSEAYQVYSPPSLTNPDGTPGAPGPGSATRMATTQDPASGEAAAIQAFSAANGIGRMLGYVTDIVNALANTFRTPLGSTLHTTKQIDWRMQGAAWANAVSSTSAGPTQQRVTVYCNEAPQTGSPNDVIQNFMAYVRGNLQ